MRILNGTSARERLGHLLVLVPASLLLVALLAMAGTGWSGISDPRAGVAVGVIVSAGLIVLGVSAVREFFESYRSREGESL